MIYYYYFKLTGKTWNCLTGNPKSIKFIKIVQKDKINKILKNLIKSNPIIKTLKEGKLKFC